MSETKQIAIIGGGISGLSLLHYLHQKYKDRSDINIHLYEKNPNAGGTIQTVEKNSTFFETGPNGFLNSKPQTLHLITELGLKNQLIHADTQAKIRYISLNNTLHSLPSNPKEFLKFQLLSPLQKLRVLCEFFMPKGHNPQETIYEFGKRRLGKEFTQLFLDPMVSGIFGGDIKQLNLKEAFPRIYQMENEYGSLFHAMTKIRKQRKIEDPGMPRGVLTSFNSGMSLIIKTLADKYQNYISYNSHVEKITYIEDTYQIDIGGKPYASDSLYLSTPSDAAARMLTQLDPEFATHLREISYSPIAVIGLLYKKESFSTVPKGFGYLIPSAEGKEVLGVLFESNIFTCRTATDKILLRVMIGGAHHREIANRSTQELIQLAHSEVVSTLKVNSNPIETFQVYWPKAIPQYDQNYCQLKEKIISKLKFWQNLHIMANYWGGIAFNDCIENAYAAVEASNF